MSKLDMAVSLGKNIARDCSIAHFEGEEEC